MKGRIVYSQTSSNIRPFDSYIFKHLVRCAFNSNSNKELRFTWYYPNFTELQISPEEGIM